jgi:hypothetical protein
MPTCPPNGDAARSFHAKEASMSRSVGFTYAIAGVVVAASTVAVVATTVGLGGPAAARARAGEAPQVVPTAGVVVPPGTLQPGEQVVRAEIAQTPDGPVQYLTVEQTASTRRARGDDDDEHEGREHENREHEEREHRSTRRESH